jgi:MerR family transcriptional regulator, light-induced transcriptional regulator
MDNLSKKSRHLIQVVGRRTGLNSDVIRAWERRYKAIVSQRTETNRRLYTDDDIEKLALLKRAINAGRRIGDIAQLSYDDLFELVMGDESNTAKSYERPSTGTVMELFDEASSSIHEMNSHKLDIALANAIAMLSTTDFLLEFLKPLHTYINDECRRGALRYVQEKFAKMSIRTCLANLYTKFRSSKKEGPKLIIGSLTSEHENLDTLMHIIVAQNIGWNVTYVGNSVPQDELSYIAEKIGARTMVIALNNHRDIARKIHEITTIKNNANQKENIILIGTQAKNYRHLADNVQVMISQDLSSFRLTLERFYSLIR